MELVMLPSNSNRILVLHKYRMSEIGTPKLKQYYPELATSTTGQQDRLERNESDEREVRISALKKADALKAAQSIIELPIHPDPSNLYHLVKVRPQLLSWSWKK